MEWNWQGKTEVLGEKPILVPLCPPQIPHGQTRDRNRASTVRGRRLTAWAKSRPISQHNSKFKRHIPYIPGSYYLLVFHIITTAKYWYSAPWFFNALWCYIESVSRGTLKEGGCRTAAPHKSEFKKNTDLVDTMYGTLYVIYPSAEISHRNRLMTSTLEFWKKRNKNVWCVRLNLKKIRHCDLNKVSHGICSYICMYINTAAGSVMLQLYLRHNF